MLVRTCEWISALFKVVGNLFSQAFQSFLRRSLGCGRIVSQDSASHRYVQWRVDEHRQIDQFTKPWMIATKGIIKYDIVAHAVAYLLLDRFAHAGTVELQQIGAAHAPLVIVV